MRLLTNVPKARDAGGEMRATLAGKVAWSAQPSAFPRVGEAAGETGDTDGAPGTGPSLPKPHGLHFGRDSEKRILVSLCTIDLNHKYNFIFYPFFFFF